MWVHGDLDVAAIPTLGPGRWPLRALFVDLFLVTLNPASALSLCWAPSWEGAEASGQLRSSALVADCLLKSINELPLAPPCLDQRGFSTSLCCPVGRSWSLSQTNPSLPFPWESSPGQGPSGSDSWPAGPRLWGPLATSVPHPS